MKSKLITLSLAAIMAVGFAQSGIAAPGKGRGSSQPPVNTPAASLVKITLVAAQGVVAKGSAKIKITPKEKEFSVEAQVPRRLAGSVLGVTVNDTVVGTMTVNALGQAKLSFNSKLGQTVPTISAGTLVGVVNASGDILLAGQF